MSNNICRCGKPVCSPSKVLCKEHLEELNNDMERLLGGNDAAAQEKNESGGTSLNIG